MPQFLLYAVKRERRKETGAGQVLLTGSLAGL
jgi:hypothetical protein